MKRSVHKNFKDYLLHAATGSLYPMNLALSNRKVRTSVYTSTRKLCFVVSLIFFCSNSFAQLTAGGVNSNFGIDADTRSGYKKYGPATSAAAADDWFASPGLGGIGVIDTSNAAYYRSQLQ